MAENKKIDSEKINIQYVINNQQEDDEAIDIRSIINKFIKYWWFFGVSILIAMSIAYLANKIIEPKYKVSTSIVINEESSMSDAPAELLNNFGFLSTNKNFANEVYLIKTSPIIQSALNKLDFRISYFKKTPLRQRELYKTAPFVVLLNQDHPQPVGSKISIKILDDKSYRISIDEKEMQLYSFVSNQVTEIISEYQNEINAQFNKYINNNYFDFKIILNNVLDIEKLKEQEFFFIINTDKNLIQNFKGFMEITLPERESTIAEISIESTTPIKAIDFLNSLNESFLNKDLQQKQYMSERTIEYIDEQLDKISESLNIAEDNLQKFRSDKKVIDVSMQSANIFDELNGLKREQARLDVNHQYVEYIQDYFRNNKAYSDLISPSAMGIDDPTLNSLIEELITLNMEKESLLDNNQEKSPYLQKINIRIDNLRSMISENIEYIKRTTSIALNDANSRIRQLNNEIEKMPETERELLGIERIFDINNNIYTYLLEKKSEAEITKVSNQPNVEIGEPADIIGSGPVSPNKTINYIIALIIGILFPIVTIYMKDLFNTNFATVEEIKEACPVSVVGEIFHNSREIEDVVAKFSDSHTAESFRKLNINLKYFLNSSKSKAIALTSTISGEGKSFIALNLAHNLANNNYKTLLAGFDIRRPKQYASLEKQTVLGISDLLSNQANMEDIVQKTKNEFLDIIYAGNIPPNPAELLASERTAKFINELKEIYDFIIIDTPPVGVVIDGFTLMDKTDLNIFVSRVKHTPKKEFEKVITDLKNKNLINGLVINDVPVERKTKYGYGYYKSLSHKKKNKLLNILSISFSIKRKVK